MGVRVILRRCCRGMRGLLRKFLSLWHDVSCGSVEVVPYGSENWWEVVSFVTIMVNDKVVSKGGGVSLQWKL